MTIITASMEKIHDVISLHIDKKEDILIYVIPEGDKNVAKEISIYNVSHILS